MALVWWSVLSYLISDGGTAAEKTPDGMRLQWEWVGANRQPCAGSRVVEVHWQRQFRDLPGQIVRQRRNHEHHDRVLKGLV